MGRTADIGAMTRNGRMLQVNELEYQAILIYP